MFLQSDFLVKFYKKVKLEIIPNGSLKIRTKRNKANNQLIGYDVPFMGFSGEGN